jgi:hypothetical protein
MRSDDLRASLFVAPAPYRRIDRSTLSGVVFGVALGLALIARAVDAATPTEVVEQTVALDLAVPLALAAFGALALVARRKAG